MLDFNELISNYLKKESRYKQIGRYYPSECGSCIRKTWYSYKLPKDTDIELIKIFEAGNMLHEFVSNILKSEKNPHINLVECETPFQLEIEDMLVSGRIDNIITVKANNRTYLVEVKSTSSLKYTEEPNQAHVMQLQIYMHNKKIHNGIIMYIEKNTLQSKSFEVKYNLKIVEEAINRFRALHKCLTLNILPEPEARKKENMDWQCKSCQWNKECYTANPDIKNSNNAKK